MMIKNLIKYFYPMKFENYKILCYHNFSKKFSEYHLNFLSRYFKNKIYRKYNCIISEKAELGKNVIFPHPLGIVIGAKAKIEDGVWIYQNVTIGRKNKDIYKCPVIKKGSIIYSNAVILGDIVLEENTIVGANSVLTDNTIKNGIYAGSPAKLVKKRGNESG